MGSVYYSIYVNIVVASIFFAFAVLLAQQLLVGAPRCHISCSCCFWIFSTLAPVAHEAALIFHHGLNFISRAPSFLWWGEGVGQQFFLMLQQSFDLCIVA